MSDGALPPGGGPFERHVFVCISGKTCPDQGGVELHRALKEAAVARGGPAFSSMVMVR